MHDEQRRARIIWLLLAALALPAACEEPGDTRSNTGEEAYVPGLGEIMSATQMRHLKLWYAGEAGNWPLVSYEVDELEEGFANAMRFHPEHKQAPRPLTELIPEFMAAPIAALQAAIAAESPAEFTAAYDAFSQACNTCHAATGFSFNAVARPAGNPYTNQRFEGPPQGPGDEP